MYIACNEGKYFSTLCLVLLIFVCYNNNWESTPAFFYSDLLSHCLVRTSPLKIARNDYMTTKNDSKGRIKCG